MLLNGDMFDLGLRQTKIFAGALPEWTTKTDGQRIFKLKISCTGP